MMFQGTPPVCAVSCNALSGHSVTLDSLHNLSCRHLGILRKALLQKERNENMQFNYGMGTDANIMMCYDLEFEMYGCWCTCMYLSLHD